MTSSGADLAAEAVAAQAVAALRARFATVATAESLTGGLVCATLVGVPGASDVVRGGVIAYTPEVKAALLGVPAELIGQRGTVDPTVAQAMAAGARRRMYATYGLATTGVAGPDRLEGKPVGTVYVAVAGPDDTTHQAYTFDGGRQAIRSQACHAALALLVERIPRVA